MKFENFNQKPINVDQADVNPYKVEATNELAPYIEEIKGRIEEMTKQMENDSSKRHEWSDLLNDMKEELKILELSTELNEQDKLVINAMRDKWASLIFSGKDNDPEIFQ